jgi:NAD(P)-dependent dehydrogenase (short-subunit alcohol dehydrogenase family)
VALVTGGRGGVGRAVCDRFKAEGAFVYAADLTALGSSTGADHDRGGDRSERFLQLDVTSEAEVAAAIATIDSGHGRLDIVVNAAGIEVEATIEEMTLDTWNRVFAVNATGTFLVCRQAMTMLRRSDHASIVNFGSYDGFIADPGLAAYCASKGAVHALTKAMACDYGPEGIRVNAVCPGYVDTPMLNQFFPDDVDPEHIKSAARAVHPLRTIGTPQDVANLVNWLAGDEARYATGQLWVLDGGLTSQVQQMRL